MFLQYRAPLILYRFPAPSTHIKRQRLFTPPPARELPLRPIANSGASNSIANDQPPASSTLHRSGDTDLLHRHIFSDPPLLPATLLPSSGDTDLLHRHIFFSSSFETLLPTLRQIFGMAEKEMEYRVEIFNKYKESVKIAALIVVFQNSGRESEELGEVEAELDANIKLTVEQVHRITS
ncbi:hypothetical protein LXL04_035879 [Taraxacum kok-saghyz]